jgi:3-methyladenine DNA glycosylase Tag
VVVDPAAAVAAMSAVLSAHAMPFRKWGRLLSRISGRHNRNADEMSKKQMTQSSRNFGPPIAKSFFAATATVNKNGRTSQTGFQPLL